MASRASLIQSRSIYVGTLNSVAPSDGNLIVTGNVGIGTTSPSGHMLDIASTAGDVNNSAIRALFPAGGGLLNTEFGALAYRGGVWTAVYGKQGAASSAAYFDGNVGIGTASPISKLNLNGGTGDGATYDSVFSLTRTSSTGNQLSSKIVLDDKDTNWGKLIFKVKTTASSAEYDAYYTDAVTIDNQNANVGIGTTSPGAALDISGGATLVANFNHSSNGTYLRWQNNGTSFGDIGSAASLVSGGSTNDFAIHARSTYNMVFSTNFAEKMRITSAGNVGIGTTAPDAKLQVVGNLRIGVGGSNDKMDILHGAGANDYGAIRFYAALNEINTIHSFPVAWQGGTIYSSSAGSLNLGGNSTFGIWYDPDVVFPVGGNSYFKRNVGIGTTSPSKKLHIYNSGPNQGLRTSNIDGINMDVLAGANGGLVGTYSNHPLSFVTNSTERARISAAGNFGIGTTAPTNIIHVVGIPRIDSPSDPPTRYTGALDVDRYYGTNEGALTSPEMWLKIDIGGTAYLIPAFAI